jgi:hypothetical protein
MAGSVEGEGANLENVRSGKADGRLSIAVVGQAASGQARRLCVSRPRAAWFKIARPRRVRSIHPCWPSLQLRPPAFRRHQFYADGPALIAGVSLILHVEDIGARLVEAFSPEMHAAGGIDELRARARRRSSAPGSAHARTPPSSRPIWRASIRLSL